MSYDPTLARWLEADPTGAEYVDGLNLYRVEDDNPVSRVDPEGLLSEEGRGPEQTNMGIHYPGHYQPAPPAATRRYPYKALPGATFSGLIIADDPSEGYATASIDFNVPANWWRPGHVASSCEQIRIVQVITRDEDWSGGFTHLDVADWVIDNRPRGAPRSPDEFYPGSSGWWNAGPTPAPSAWIIDQPGTRPGFFRDQDNLMEFRDYAVAIGGPDNGKSFGYIDWGLEWSNPAYGGPTFEHVWMGRNLGTPGAGGGATGVFRAGVRYAAPPQSPMPGGVEVTLPDRAEPIP